jgi:hypothetical protein
VPGLLVLAALLVAAPACGRPYPGPKTMAAIGTGLLLGGAAAWIIGERTGTRGLIVPGYSVTIAGASTIAAAGGWLAASISCRADPDCPEGEVCKEIPAAPGGIPYRQCMRR